MVKVTKKRLKDPSTREAALLDLAQWIIDTCLFFGALPETAFEVAAMFIRGVRRSWEDG